MRRPCYISAATAVTACGDLLQACAAIERNRPPSYVTSVPLGNGALLDLPHPVLLCDIPDAVAIHERAEYLGGKVIRSLKDELRRATLTCPLFLTSSHFESGALSLLVASGSNSSLPLHILERVLPTTLGKRLAAVSGATRCIIGPFGACASGLLAVGAAMTHLRLGRAAECTVVSTDPLSLIAAQGFALIGASSPTACRPFDVTADGTTVAEGAAAIMLTTQPPSIGRDVHEIEGFGQAIDAISPTRNSARALAEAITSALADAQTGPDTIDGVVWHGTATPSNDATEHQVAMEVFSDRPPAGVSIKGAVGHTMGTSGLLNLLYSLRASSSGVMAQSPLISRPKFERMNINLSRCSVPQWSRWLVVASGFGGQCAAAVLSTGRSQ